MAYTFAPHCIHYVNFFLKEIRIRIFYFAIDYFRATPTVNVGLKPCLFLKCREIKNSWLSEDPNESVNVGSGSFGVCEANYLAGERVCVKTFKSQRKE